jgi:hypothetical protein
LSLPDTCLSPGQLRRLMLDLSRPSDLSGVSPRRKALGSSRASSPRAGSLFFSAPPTPRSPGLAGVQSAPIAVTGVTSGDVIGGCIAVMMVTAAPVSSTGGCSSKPQTSENGDTLKDSAQMPTSTEASSSDGFLSPRTGTLPQPVQCPTNPQGRVADGGVTPSSDSTMMGATAWRTCMSKQRARHLPHTLASNGFPSPINRQLPRAGLA